MKSVEQNDIGNGKVQGYVNRRSSNFYGRCPRTVQSRHYFPPWILWGDIFQFYCGLHGARLRAELKHINKPRRRNQNEIALVAASEDAGARPEAARRCGRALPADELPQSGRAKTAKSWLSAGACWNSSTA